jgi:acetoin utilization deacetylase AcuC-like enzyme
MVMLVLHDELMQEHDPGHGHPEAPARLAAVKAALEALPGLVWRAPKQASREHVERVHDAAYVERIERLRGRATTLDADTHLSEASVDAAFLAAGAAVDAVDAVMSGEHKTAFALVRPPGHHAEAATAMGFCIFNNVAVAAAHAIGAHGLERVLVVDWDVHHGNGTQHSFSARRDVLFVSLHQFPFYPGTGSAEESGSGAGLGFTINIPFPGGCDDADYRAAFADVVLPAADAFAPELVLVSAGFDAHRRDPLANMLVSEEGYADMAAGLRAVAERHAKGRIVLTLEGGYDLTALAKSARATVEVLEGTTPADGPASPTRGAGAITRVRAVHHGLGGPLGRG